MKYALLTAIAILTIGYLTTQPVILRAQAEDDCPYSWVVTRLPGVGLICITDYDRYIDALHHEAEPRQETHR